MLSLTENSERYSLECHKYGPHDFLYTIFSRRRNSGWRDSVVFGRGKTKAGAMLALLENWRSGKTRMPYVAGSADELKLRLAVTGRIAVWKKKPERRNECRVRR